MSMLVIEQKKGEQIIKSGERVKDINIVLSGAVRMKTKNEEFLLESGSVIGLLECSTGKYVCDYYADEDTLIVSYAYNQIDDFAKIFEEQPQYIYAFLHATLVQCQMLLDRHNQLQTNASEMYLFSVKQYREYILTCRNMNIEPVSFEKAKDIKSIVLTEPIRDWEVMYIDALSKQTTALMKQFYMTRQQLCVGEMMRTSELMNRAVLEIEQLNEYIERQSQVVFADDENDIIGLWFEIAKKMACLGEDLEPINKKMRQMQGFFTENSIFPSKEIFMRFQKYWQFDFKAYAKEHEEEQKSQNTDADFDEIDYFEYIISYAGYEQERKDELRVLMEEFRKVAGSESNDRRILEIRKNVTEMFFETYRRVFFKIVETDEDPSTILQLFLRFGFMDSGLLEEGQINELLVVNRLIDEKKCEHVYTFYEWLKMILSGEKETSKNEFDLDYFASLREMRKANKITADEEKMYQRDKVKKVQFELDNMFRTASKATYGRSSGYTPVLCGSALNIPLEKMILSQDKIIQAIDKIRAIDYRCFYREVLFFDPAHESFRMMIQKEVLPDVILLPNAGQRGMMWQEVESVSRESSARFLFPILSIADLDTIMIDVVGKYRWEICRKMQGVRWNDISEPSLTSEYYDFLEFYKKNRLLSSEGKEKLKSTLTRVKGSFREFFVLDYINWIRYESSGNFRLNKVSREILSRYCPFPHEIRYKLIENPMFKGIFSKYENLMIQKENKIKNSLSRYKNEGGEITQELMDTLHFYSR